MGKSFFPLLILLFFLFWRHWSYSSALDVFIHLFHSFLFISSLFISFIFFPLLAFPFLSLYPSIVSSVYLSSFSFLSFPHAVFIINLSEFIQTICPYWGEKLTSNMTRIHWSLNHCPNLSRVILLFFFITLHFRIMLFRYVVI